MDWLEKVKTFAFDQTHGGNSPATKESLEILETICGAKLPKDFCQVYLEIGDGGFGVGGHLMKINSIQNSYSSFLAQEYFVPERRWNPDFLPICDGGCDLLGVMNLQTQQIGFVMYEVPAPLPLEDVIEWKAPTFKSWLEFLMNGKDVMQYSIEFWHKLETLEIATWKDTEYGQTVV